MKVLVEVMHTDMREFEVELGINPDYPVDSQVCSGITEWAEGDQDWIVMDWRTLSRPEDEEDLAGVLGLIPVSQYDSLEIFWDNSELHVQWVDEEGDIQDLVVKDDGRSYSDATKARCLQRFRRVIHDIVVPDESQRVRFSETTKTIHFGSILSIRLDALRYYGVDVEDIFSKLRDTAELFRVSTSWDWGGSELVKAGIEAWKAEQEN